MNTPTNQDKPELCSLCSDSAVMSMPEENLNLCLKCAARLVTKIADQAEEIVVITDQPLDNIERLPSLLA